MQSCEGDLYFVSIFMLLLFKIVKFCACVLSVKILILHTCMLRIVQSIK